MPFLRFLTTERLVFVIYLVILAGFVSAYNADVFLHLTAGRYIVENGSLPHRDVFSFTIEGQPWIMHEWLYQVLIFLLYDSLGMLGLQLLTGLACVLTLLLIKKSADVLSGGSWVTWLVLGVVFVSLLRFMSPRPALVTMLLFAYYLYALISFRSGKKQSLLYWLPPLMILWVNSHGGFIVGLVLIAYFTVLYVIDTRLHNQQWEVPKELVVVFLLCLCASMLNPYGYKQLVFPFQLMGEWAVGLIPEWMPPDFSKWHNLVYLGVVIGFTLLVLTVKSRERVFAAGLALPFVLASFSAVRHALLAVFVMAPYITLLLKTSVMNQRQVFQPAMSYLSGFRQERPRNDLGDKVYVLNGMVLIVFLLALYLVYPLHRSVVAEQEKNAYPIKAVRYLENNDIAGNLFAPMDYSNYIQLFMYPRIKVFYDVRVEIYGEKLAREYVRMITVEDGWQELFHRHAIDVVVTKASGRLYAGLSDDAAYGKVHEDETNAVFLRMDH